MTNVELVRAMIGDTNPASYICTDAELTAFLEIGFTPYKAAAIALRKIAATKAFVAKRIKAGNYEEDTTRGSADLILSLAKDYEKMDNETPADASVEIIYNDFNYRTILRNKVLRLESIYETE